MHPASSPKYHGSIDWRNPWFKFLLCCFVLICGLRFFLIQKYSDPAAFFADDVEAIAHRILVPFEKGTLAFSSLFTPHNGDHVIFVTRVWEMLWYKINGEWDVQLSMMVKTPVYAAAMTIFIHLFTRGLERRRYAAAAVLAVLFAFPFNYHNLLWAFQSQFDFFFLTAALGWLALLNGRPVLALMCAAVSPFVLGAGPVLAASYVPFALAAGFISKTWAVRKALLFTGAAVAIAVIGASFPDDTAVARSGTLADKAAALFKLYAWPFSNLLSAVERLADGSNVIPPQLVNFPSAESSWVLWFAAKLERYPFIVVLINLATAVMMIAPMALLALHAARKWIPLRFALGPLNLSVFAGLMVTATAIARTDMSTIALRFVDHVSLAGFASIVAAFVFATHEPRWRPWLAAWGLVLGFGYIATMGVTLSQIESRRNPHVMRDIVQRYYAGTVEEPGASGAPSTNRAAMLENNAYNRFFMGGDLNIFLNILDDPELRLVLPKTITEPGSAPGRAAYVAKLIGQQGLLIALFAAGCGAFIAYRVRRNSRLGAGASVAPSASAATV